MKNMASLVEFLEADDEQPDDDIGGRAVAGSGMLDLVQSPVCLSGRSRPCGFWVHQAVRDGVFYVVDTEQLSAWPANIQSLAEGKWVPPAALLVMVNEAYAAQIRKALSSWRRAPHPSVIAARMIDSQCKNDTKLAARMNWKVKL